MRSVQRSMVDGWRRYAILMLVAILFIMLISSSLLSSGYDSNFFVDIPEMPRKPNSTWTSHGLKMLMPSGKSNMSPIFKADWGRVQQESVTTSDEQTNKTQRITLNTLTLSNMALPKFNNSFRNPCWYDWYGEKTTLRCFPYFYLAGFPKSSTTDLYHRLVAHPLVIGGVRKGTQYFGRTYFNTTLGQCRSEFDCASVTFSSKYFSTAAEMVSMTRDTKLLNSTFIENVRKSRTNFPKVAFMEAFPQESLVMWQEGQKVNKYPGIIVDGSPSTSWDHTKFRQVTENQPYGYPRNISADWIRQLYPGSKIIMILREPVSRAFSHYTMYLMHRKRVPSVKDFHRRVQETISRIKQCLESDKPDILCTAYEYSVHLHPSMYYYHLKTWFEKLPRKQFLILKYEDYVANMPETLAKVFKFLDLPAVSQEGLEFMCRSTVLNVSTFKGGQMLEETRDQLTKFFKPMNEKLARLLGDSRFLWK